MHASDRLTNLLATYSHLEVLCYDMTSWLFLYSAFVVADASVRFSIVAVAFGVQAVAVHIR